MKLDAELRKLALRRITEIVRKDHRSEPLAKAVMLAVLEEQTGRQVGIAKAAVSRTGPKKPKVQEPTLEGLVPASLNILKARGMKRPRKPMARVYSLFALNRGKRFTPKRACEHLHTDKVSSVGKIMRKLAKAGILQHDPDGEFLMK